MDVRYWAALAAVCVALASCGGGGGGTNLVDGDDPPADDNPPPQGETGIAGLPTGGATTITTTACSPVSGDSTQNADGSANFTPGHSAGGATYGLLTTRHAATGEAVTMDYMVHQPTGTPKALLILIAGGGLDSGIEGSGTTVTESGPNFLVRSAHRFAEQGYRVVTLDRPSDHAAQSSGNGGFDAYRNSMRHAVDIAAVATAENAENLPVLLVGTSRGGVSAVANNTLATGIVLTTPLTSGGGLAIGSGNLPVSRLERPTHVLFHQDEGCPYNTPAGARSLFEAIKGAGLYAGGDEVSGGFRDTVVNDPCGPLDYHGFTGIEACAVGRATGWVDALLGDIAAVAPDNQRPQAADQSVAAGASIALAATDADGDALTFAVPYESTALGGTVSTTAEGAVSYSAPNGVSGTTDRFVFTVHDGKGGIAFGTVSVELP